MLRARRAFTTPTLEDEAEEIGTEDLITSRRRIPHYREVLRQLNLVEIDLKRRGQDYD